ncbi:MAG: hypothetical protein WD025_02650 [Bacteriovoracaceae bacterium]
MDETIKLNNLDDYRAAAKKYQGQPELFLKDKEFFKFQSSEYQSVQTHSSCIDLILGIPVAEIEKELRERAKKLWPGGTIESWSQDLYEGAMTWVGLNPAQLQTPYAEIYDLFKVIDLKKRSLVVDLGAGYGRLGVVLGLLCPECEFLGFEMAQERVEAGNALYSRLELPKTKLIQKNIAADEFELPAADVFFIYDFGSLPDMKKLLAKLDELADKREAFSVIARGRGINALIQETAPWLTVKAKEAGNSVIYTYV